MAKVTLKGNPLNTSGDLPPRDAKAPGFSLVNKDLSETSLSEFSGKRVILNIFPSIDTSTCATSVRKFNEKAAGLDNIVVLCISADLPFAQNRFCAAEGVENVVTLSAYRDRGAFADEYGVGLMDGPLQGLLARSIVVIDENGSVKHTELVPEIVDEPDYDRALAAF